MRKSRSEGICDGGNRQLAREQERILKTHVLREHVWDEPSDGLSLDFCLEVDTLDGEEDFAQSTCPHHVELPLGGEARAVGNDGSRNGRGSGQRSEQDDKRQTVVQITQRVGESRISASGRNQRACDGDPGDQRDLPLLDDVVDPVHGFRLFQILCQSPFSTTDSL